ncbi:acylphosphatase [Candidatus Parcubacteria bacterium]|jgi:acylphosphatase|nr:acylphosphatase [Candidatus Parcubacteria bacterium]MBT3949291.1 acylphosphatase [Candidatus Parcubacteria bacterium]
MKRLTLKIYGDVQNVFFRQNVFDVAKELNLTGWVRNDKDGCVSVVAEGEENKLNELLDYCSEGPKMSMVEDVVEKREHIKAKKFEEFKIIY